MWATNTVALFWIRSVFPDSFELSAAAAWNMDNSTQLDFKKKHPKFKTHHVYHIFFLLRVSDEPSLLFWSFFPPFLFASTRTWGQTAELDRGHREKEAEKAEEDIKYPQRHHWVWGSIWAVCYIWHQGFKEGRGQSSRGGQPSYRKTEWHPSRQQAGCECHPGEIFQLKVDLDLSFEL